MTKIFYHGSPTPDITVLEPRFDPRLGVEGLFVSDEPFGPMLFALLPVRAHAAVDYTTKNGTLSEGEVITPFLNEEGWLYTVQVKDEIVEKSDTGQSYLTEPVQVMKAERVSKEDILRLGWRVEIKDAE